MSAVNAQKQVDANNATFWSELCGSLLARQIGVTDASPQSLRRFDRAYIDFFPYLEGYLPWRSGERLLEIGLGYGTVGELLARRGLDYHGLDIAPGPVEMMRHRLNQGGVPDADARATTGSALAIPHPDASFDAVVSIGCLHHTGDLATAISEVHRVLRPGGDAVVMVYNRHSYRHAVMLPVQALKQGRWRDRAKRDEFLRAAYDANAEGAAAPATEFASAADMRRMFAGFSDVSVHRENFDDFLIHFRGHSAMIPRHRFLGNVARLVGSDLYVTAKK